MLDQATKPPGTIENGVLIGHDGYLFLAGGGHDVLQFVTGQRAVAPENFEIFRRNISLRAGWAAAHGAKYLHIIMPDKQSIIPEAWPLERPIRLGETYMHKVADLQPLCLYPADFLSRQGWDVVTKADTHLSMHGSLLVAALLAEGFTGEPQTQLLSGLLAKLDVTDRPPNDLGCKLTPMVCETVRRLSVAPPGARLSNSIPGGNNGLVDLRFNPQAPYRKCIAIFGDSFGRDIAALLQFWFAEVYFFRTGYFHPEIAEQCRPDILITQNIERYLPSCLDDENRPNFLLFPHLNEKLYEPSKSFTEALSAVLSFPRAPYTRFVAALGLTPRPSPLPPAATAAAPTRLPAIDYDNLLLTDMPGEQDMLQVLEAPRNVELMRPAMVADLSGRDLRFEPEPVQHSHGSYLVQRRDVLLFGPNNLVNLAGQWSCEARAFKQQFIDFYQAPVFNVVFPGAKPEIRATSDGLRLGTAGIADEVMVIDEPVYLATPLEPTNWGRWIATVVPKTAQFQQLCEGRKFFCHTALTWERALLRLLGVPDEAILPHDPGRTYICRDVMTVEYSVTNMSISPAERAIFYQIVATKQKHGTYPAKIFVSRLSRSKAQPQYRALQNEAALAAALEAEGFTTIEPEAYPIEVQIGMFAAAEQVVFLGGAGVFNAVFCRPGISVITIESTNNFVRAHCTLLASLDLRYGVIFGAVDQDDPRPEHKRWTLDIDRAMPSIKAFFSPS